MSCVLLDVTDVVEFLQRQESVSGVQRVIVNTAPSLISGTQARPVVLDRGRGQFVELTDGEVSALVLASHAAAESRAVTAAAANACLDRARSAEPASIGPDTVMVFLGAVWINDALMMAARQAHAKGARMVYLLYDLTPVMETGHTAAVNRLFERYLWLVMQTACAVPAISQSSRDDFVRYCHGLGQAAPPGSATGLPCGITPGQFDTAAPPWPRDYALFIGTVESRKNHLLALRAWQRLIELHGREEVPDLVCIGRLGWHASEFIDAYVRTKGLGGKVSLLSTSLSDEDLARFLAHASFTVYPSRYEGWGLPVSESLAFGKVPIVARNSSIPEAGGDLAVYFDTDDLDAFVRAVEQSGLDRVARRDLQARIVEEYRPMNWEDVADAIQREIDRAGTAQEVAVTFPKILIGREYVIATRQPPPDAGHSDQVMRHVQSQGLTPMLRQPRDHDDYQVVDAAVIGSFGSPQTWGYEIRPGKRADFRFTRPVDGDLTLLVSTRSMPGVVTIEAVGPGGPVRDDVYLGSVISLPLGEGRQGEPAQVWLSVTDAHDSIEGFLGIRSFVVLRADDLSTQVIALQSAAQALRQELDFMRGTRSWKVTAPLRRFKGRGSSGETG